MTYDAKEKSRFLGEPVNLYLFRYGEGETQFYAFTDAEVTINHGGVDITGTATTSAVTLPIAEPDAAYRVTGLTVGKVSGTPAAASYNAHLSTFPTTAGFTIELDAAPGAGNTVRVWWAIER